MSIYVKIDGKTRIFEKRWEDLPESVKRFPAVAFDYFGEDRIYNSSWRVVGRDVYSTNIRLKDERGEVRVVMYNDVIDIIQHVNWIAWDIEQARAENRRLQSKILDLKKEIEGLKEEKEVLLKKIWKRNRLIKRLRKTLKGDFYIF